MVCGGALVRRGGLPSGSAGENSRSTVFLAFFLDLILSLDTVDEREIGLLVVCERRVRVEEARMRRGQWVTLQGEGDPFEDWTVGMMMTNSRWWRSRQSSSGFEGGRATDTDEGLCSVGQLAS